MSPTTANPDERGAQRVAGTTAIVLAGGTGQRVGLSLPKQLLGALPERARHALDARRQDLMRDSTRVPSPVPSVAPALVPPPNRGAKEEGA